MDKPAEPQTPQVRMAGPYRVIEVFKQDDAACLRALKRIWYGRKS